MSVNFATRLPASRTEEWTRRHFLWILPSVLQDLHQCLLSIQRRQADDFSKRKYIWRMRASLSIGTHCRRCSRTRPSICTRCTVCADPRFGSCHWCSFALLLLDMLGQCTKTTFLTFIKRKKRAKSILMASGNVSSMTSVIGGPCCHHPRVAPLLLCSLRGSCNRSAFNNVHVMLRGEILVALSSYISA